MITTLYIGADLIEQYKDESVDLVSSVLDITDITKNNGDYTKTFTVPASKQNSKLFKHYYDANIDNSFDARIKIEGHIELGGIPFKIGKWRLSKVSVKKNKPDSYTINFFGNLVDLKDTLGKDELTDLDLSALDHDYNTANIKNGLAVGGLFSGDIIYNLLAKKRYLFDDTSYVAPDEFTRNIAYGGDTDSGVVWNDLRPSIRLLKIIEAIEEKYTVANGYENPIVFSRDFFNTSEFTNLYMWLSPDADGDIRGERQIVDWDGGSSANVSHATDIGTFTIEPNSRWEFKVTVTNLNLFNPAWATLRMFVDGVVAQEQSRSIGAGVLTFPLIMESTITSNELVDKEVYYDLDVYSSFGAGNVSVEWEQTKYDSSGAQVGSTVTTTSSATAYNDVVYVSENFPKLKTLDFLKGLFNAFKLVIVPQDNGTLYIDTLSSYYSAGTVYDVSKYIDFESYNVERGQILNEIELKFQEPTTILNIEFEKNNDRGYGDEELKLKDDNGKLLDGESLTFTLPFEQIVYERLTDQASGDITNIQYGAVIDEDLEPASPKAHIFYNLVADTTNSRIGFIDYLSVKTQLNALINTPYHHYGVNLPTYATVFKNEFSTWDGASMDNNLYSNHYQSYVNNIFNIKKRTFIFNAVLPIHIATKLQLNDTLIIKGNYYRIDKYSYNLLTGKSVLTLINNFETSIGEPSASNDIIYSNYIAKTEVTQVTNLQDSSTIKVDNGWGTTWATITTNNNNLEIALDEFSTTNGDVRSMIIRTTGISEVADIYVNQSDKGKKPLTFDSEIIKFDSDIITWDQTLT